MFFPFPSGILPPLSSTKLIQGTSLELPHSLLLEAETSFFFPGKHLRKLRVAIIKRNGNTRTFPFQLIVLQSGEMKLPGPAVKGPSQQKPSYLDPGPFLTDRTEKLRAPVFYLIFVPPFTCPPFIYMALDIPIYHCTIVEPSCSFSV